MRPWFKASGEGNPAVMIRSDGTNMLRFWPLELASQIILSGLLIESSSSFTER